MDERDEAFLRRAFVVARRSVENGNTPFGAVLVDANGDVVLEGESTVLTDNPTGHAELNLMQEAGRRFDPGYLAECTLYTSCEPCAMCAGSVSWVGVRRVVYGLDAPSLDEIVGEDPTNRLPHARAEAILSGGRLAVAVDGPALLDEARAVHRGYWGVVEAT